MTESNPLPADPLHGQPHEIVERDGVRYTLLGTAITSEQDMVRENGRWYGKDTMKALSDALDQPAASAEVAEEEVTEEPAPMEEDDEEVTE